MNNRKLHSLYGLKWNPFLPDLPLEALIVRPQINHFGWKVENLVLDGGFALITGDPGLGKSSAFRILQDRLNQVGDICVVEFTRPQSGITDFYRELGRLFDIDFKTTNRYGGHQSLRDKWNEHINGTLFRPVLLIDEAQEVHPVVLSELRLLTSTCFDSKIILTVVIGGDSRLQKKMKHIDLLPLKSRIRTKLTLEPYPKDELLRFLKESLKRAGNPVLMSDGLMETVVEHANGNPRELMTMCGDLLMEAAKQEIKQMDEDFFLKIFSPPVPKRRKK